MSTTTKEASVKQPVKGAVHFACDSDFSGTERAVVIVHTKRTPSGKVDEAGDLHFCGHHVRALWDVVGDMDMDAVDPMAPAPWILPYTLAE